MEEYSDAGAVNCDVDFDTTCIRGKTAIVTGGANGIGEAYVQALAKAGASVVIGDLDSNRGEKLASELPGVRFVKCDVTLWEDQLEMFKVALSSSPSKSVDIVVVNAGISGKDDVFAFEEDQEHPAAPAIKILQINLIGAMYTTKLALHYFRRQHAFHAGRGSCLVLQGSLAGYLDLAGTPQYSGSKYGLRGMMRSLRRTAWMHGTRVNIIAPWFIKTRLMSEAVENSLTGVGIEFAESKDAASGLMRIVSDSSVTGRSIAIVPRSWAPRGYKDMESDDYAAENWIAQAQEQALVPSHRLKEAGRK